MKRIFGLISVVVMLLCLTACSDNTVSEIKGDEVAKENEIQDTLVSENSNNKENVPEELTVDFVKNYPVTDASQFEIEEVDGGVAIDNYIGSDAIVVIPEEINGKTVVAVGRRAFQLDENIKAVKLADSIKELGDEAFLGCDNLEIFICGKNLEMIDEYAIGACLLLRKLELNDGLKTIGMFAISKGSMEELYIPSSVTSIHKALGNDGLKIICEAGSVAEQHAIQNNCIYEVR